MSKSQKVLMLSGDARLVSVYKRLIVDAGYGFKSVSSGEKALQFMKDKGPVAFIADRATPKEDVFDVLMHKKRYETIRHIPVFVLSHVSDPEDVALARELGAHSYSISLHSHPERVVGRIIKTIKI